MAAYDDHSSANHYEYDHLVPLELGGATNDRRNLWPEPGASPNPKDLVENAFNHKVCDGKMTLARARRLIARNWVTVYHSLYDKSSWHSSPPPASPLPSCRVNASYSSSYPDWDVYIHSNQADKKATVTDSYGRSASWRTDENGYADVYFHAPRSAAEESIGPTSPLHPAQQACRPDVGMHALPRVCIAAALSVRRASAAPSPDRAPCSARSTSRRSRSRPTSIQRFWDPIPRRRDEGPPEAMGGAASYGPLHQRFEERYRWVQQTRRSAPRWS